jgi:hypothetical protein
MFIVTRISLNRLELASITLCHCERSEAISFCQAGDCFVAALILSLSKGSSQ